LGGGWGGLGIGRGSARGGCGAAWAWEGGGLAGGGWLVQRLRR